MHDSAVLEKLIGYAESWLMENTGYSRFEDTKAYGKEIAGIRKTIKYAVMLKAKVGRIADSLGRLAATYSRQAKALAITNQLER
jgi:hypothetical protein